MATELGTAYVSIVAETSKLEAGIKAALDGGGKHSDIVGKDIGKRISESASKALKDGWRPDQDIMAGIPDTKLDRVGARIGQVIGKGMVVNMRAREAGVQFANSFGDGAGSIGLGRVVAGWRKEIAGSGGGALNAIGFLAGKTLSAGLTAAAGAGVAGIGLALTKGFERLEKIDSATSKLNQMNKVAERMGKPLIDVQKTVTAVKDSVYGTPYSLDAAFGIAVQAIGAGSKDINKFMKDVTDAAGFAGDDLGHMGLVLTQVLSKGKADGGDMMQLMEAGLPAKSWIEDSYNLTSDQFEKMQAKGEITMDMLQKSIEDHAGGMAKAAGNTLEGSIGNMQTAVARAGADFLSAMFGGPGGDPTEGMKEAVNRITDYLKRLDDWINAHREDIKKFFDGAKDAAAELLKVVGSLGDILKEHPDLIKNVFEAFALWKGLKFTGLLAGLGEVSNALGSKGGVGLLGKLALVAEAMNLIDDFTNRQKPAKPGEFKPSEPVNAGPSIGKQALDIGAGAWLGSKVGGVPGALFGGAVAGMVRPAIDIVSAGPGPATNGALPSALPGIGAGGQINGQTPNVGGIPIPGLSQKITPTVDTGPALSALGALRDGQKEPIVIPADSDTAPASGTTGAWRTDEAGNPVVIPVDADTSSANASMAAFIDKWSSAIISPKVVVPGQVTPGPGGGPPTLAGLLGVPGKAMGGGISGPGSSTSDSIPAMLSTGEHVFTAKDVSAMGGQSGVYAFRKALHAASGGAVSNGVLKDMRTAGAIPAAAGSTAKAGTSGVASVIGMGGEIINGIIDQAASAVSTAASAAATAASAGAAGPEGGAAAGAGAQFAIGLASNTAKRGIKYGFDLLGIGADSLLQQLTPFGQPRWLNQDYTGFMPKEQITSALGNLMSGGANQAAGTVDPNTTEHGTGAGAQPGAVAGPLEQLGQSVFDGFSKALPSGAIEPVAPTPMVGDANSFLSTQLAAPSSPPPPGQQPIFKVDNIYTQDVDSLGRELNKQGRLAQMQYTNRPGP